MLAQLTTSKFELKAELASGHYLHLQYGTLCYGEKLKTGVLKVQNAPLQTASEVQHLINLIAETKDPVGAVKLYLMESADVKTELVLGSVCTTALWCSKNLAKFSELSKLASPPLFELNQALKFYRYSSGESFPEIIPFARIPDLEDFKDRTRMIFYHSKETEVTASRYSLWSTHSHAVNSLAQERIACGVETKSYQLLSSSYYYSSYKHALYLFIPKDMYEIQLERRCIDHFEKVIEMIDPAIKLNVHFLSHALL